MEIILIVQNLRGRDGWSRYALELGKELASRGQRVTAIVQETSNQNWCEEVSLLSSPLRYLGNPLLSLLHAWRVGRFLARKNPDIVHMMVEPYALLVPFLKKGRWKMCLTIHGSYTVVPLAQGGITAKLMRRAYRVVDRILSVSRFTKEYLKSQDPILFERAALQDKIHVLPNAVRLPDSSEESVRMEEEPKHIIRIGAIKERKGYLQLVDACAEFSLRHPDVRYKVDLFGSLTDSKKYVQTLREKIRTRKLEEVIRLCGSVSDSELTDAYRQADLFLLLSLHTNLYVEGFGLVFLEANSHGIPAIGPTTGGCPEAISDGVSGYVCDPENPVLVSKRMYDILVSQKISSKQCRKWAAEHSIEQAAKQLEEEYLTLCRNG